jgi:hypothetical protein
MVAVYGCTRFRRNLLFLIDAAAAGRDHVSGLKWTVYENIGVTSLE